MGEGTTEPASGLGSEHRRGEQGHDGGGDRGERERWSHQREQDPPEE